MNIVRLEKVADIIMGQSPPSDTYNLLGNGLPFFQGKTDFGEMYPKVRMYCDKPNKIAQVGDILISVRAPVGPTNICITKSCIGRGLAALRAKEELSQQYLLYFLRYIEPVLAQSGQGSTFEAIGKDELRYLQVPLPHPDEQKRIVAILTKADRLRRLRRFALEISGDYLQAVFLEMFGDITKNSNSWKIKPLGELSSIASGVTKGQRFNGRDTEIVPYLRVANVQDGYLDLTEIKTIEALSIDVEKYQLQPGDILMTEGGDFDKLGRGTIWWGEIPGCIHQNHIFRVRLDQAAVEPKYFASMLQTQHTKQYFLRASKQTTNLATINMTQLKGLPVAVPPPPLQQQFAQIVRQSERLRAQQREALRQAELLFQTLLHQAFNGVL